MDYFYVGNHANSVGLNDLFFRLGGKILDAIFMFDVHSFSANANIAAGANKAIGTEIDFTVKYPLHPGMTLQAGYSHLMATESMQLIRGGDTDQNHNRAYLQVSFNPTLLKTN